MLSKALLQEELASYFPQDTHLAQTQDFLAKTEAPFTRKTLAGHITASAILVDERFQFVALIWHEKIGRWFQPGGHCEPDLDSTLQNAALRELLEETAITPEAPQLIQQAPFDIDVHRIPARPTEPEHWHYDIRYLFQAPYAALPQSQTCLWKPLADVLADPDDSRARFARKIQELASANP